MRAEVTASWRAQVTEARTELIAQARRFTAQELAQAPFPVSAAIAGAAKLVVSELITNACKYAPGPCLLEVAVDTTGVDLAVTDASPVLARPLPPGSDRVGQHGLEIVRALATVYRTEHVPGGKRTTVRLGEPKAPRPPGPDAAEGAPQGHPGPA